MKKVLGVIVAVVIIWISGIISMLLKAMIEISRTNIENISEFQFILMGLVPFIPFIIGIWLVKLSWRKITYETPKLVNEKSKDETSLTKAVINHSKDIASEIKPALNEYKEKHSYSNTSSKETITSITNNLDINEDEIYEQVMIEIEEDNKVKSTWAKALAQSEGDKGKAEAEYIRLRVFNIIQEIQQKKRENLQQKERENLEQKEREKQQNIKENQVKKRLKEFQIIDDYNIRSEMFKVISSKGYKFINKTYLAKDVWDDSWKNRRFQLKYKEPILIIHEDNKIIEEIVFQGGVH